MQYTLILPNRHTPPFFRLIITRKELKISRVQSVITSSNKKVLVPVELVAFYQIQLFQQVAFSLRKIF
jgi:hypothetical protein